MGVVDEEVSTRVPSDVVVSGEVWVDLNSISESESCGKVLLNVSEGLGFWSTGLTIDYKGLGVLSHLHIYNSKFTKELLLSSPLNNQVLYSQIIHQNLLSQ